jgi:hypothetical protein
MGPDDVCREYGERPINLTIRDLGTVMLIEGSCESLEFLGKLLIEQARATDDGFELSPNGPGSYFFDTGSTKGVYIHRKQSY